MVRGKKDSSQLTEVELEMMNIIWRLEKATIHQIIEHLPKDRDLAYTTVSTMVRILEQKKFVTSTKDGRGHIYSAAVSKDEYEESTVNHIVKKVFEGEPTLLVRRLLASEDLSAKDIEELKKLIEQR